MKHKADQAATLRKIIDIDTTDEARLSSTLPRVLSITSGKGGVGKTNIVANLGYVLRRMGYRVFILDADMGLANIDVLLGLAPRYTFQHVFQGEKKLHDIIIDGPAGMKILPASSGVQELSELTQEQKLFLLSEFSAFGRHVDILLIDTGAGISSNVMYFNIAAQEKLVVVTPEPTSITDAYAIIKVMAQKYAEKRFSLIVNQAKDEDEARSLYSNLSSVAERFLSVAIDYMGYIAHDPHVPLAVRSQKLVTMLYPRAAASLCFTKLAKRLLDHRPDQTATGNIGFFWDALLTSSP
ncbi:MAG: MinD/ParA family protein [Desulfobacterota bacterium]|nr:MinD/ParA family protein [Thermodesulfobacteriota bacterium]